MWPQLPSVQRLSAPPRLGQKRHACHRMAERRRAGSQHQGSAEGHSLQPTQKWPSNDCSEGCTRLEMAVKRLFRTNRRTGGEHPVRQVLQIMRAQSSEHESVCLHDDCSCTTFILPRDLSNTHKLKQVNIPLHNTQCPSQHSPR